SDEETGLSVRIESFSYKRGVPSGLDMVFDCRFLRNPHWVEDLRPLDGRDAPVAEYVGRDDRYTRFLDNVTELLEFLLPAFRSEGKAYLSVGFGCTGGRHRSVAVSEAVAKLLEDAASGVSIRHRELERRRMSAGSVEKSRE
ncbi:MAG: RapZ C-terminal domain-containing protein, partial [Rubricella sp.]